MPCSDAVTPPGVGPAAGPGAGTFRPMPVPDADRQATLSGWGRTAPTAARLRSPATAPQTVAAVREAGARGTLARGLGRSYGDAAQNAGGTVLEMTRMAAIHSIDADRGEVHCDAGVSLDTMMRVLLPLGWFVPVTPGTRYVTVGGALAADIHGKNHHVSGSFSRHLGELELLGADGTVRRLTPDADPELFWATAGGMGLTGIVLTARIRLHRVHSALMSVDTERCTDLDELMARLQATDHHYRYSVAWIDLLARGAATGRAVLTRGDHADPEQLDRRQARDPLAFRTPRLPTVPHGIPGSLLNTATVGAFNALWYHKAPCERRGQLQKISSFFHPLDGLPEWNRIYGARGFLQYQFVVPQQEHAALRRIVETISRHRCPAFLAVLKRFGPADPGWLSFPMPGWTLALDIPTALPGLDRLLDTLDEHVLGAGGRVYLAKDSRLRPQTLEAMYPRLDDFRQLRARIDPHRRFTSDLARRLDL